VQPPAYCRTLLRSADVTLSFSDRTRAGFYALEVLPRALRGEVKILQFTWNSFGTFTAPLSFGTRTQPRSSCPLAVALCISSTRRFTVCSLWFSCGQFQLETERQQPTKLEWARILFCCCVVVSNLPRTIFVALILTVAFVVDYLLARQASNPGDCRGCALRPDLWSRIHYPGFRQRGGATSSFSHGLTLMMLLEGCCCGFLIDLSPESRHSALTVETTPACCISVDRNPHGWFLFQTTASQGFRQLPDARGHSARFSTRNGSGRPFGWLALHCVGTTVAPYSS